MNNNQTYNLRFKRTVSKARDTWGYNICTLYVNGTKVASCKGGGYDMKGTCLGDWLQDAYQDRLKRLFAADLEGIKEADYRKIGRGEGRTVPYASKEAGRPDLYGAYVIIDRGVRQVHLDGACGFSSMQSIAWAIGITIDWNPASEGSKTGSWYTAIDNGYPERASH